MTRSKTKSVVRDLQVDVERVEAKNVFTGSTMYVFALRPRADPRQTVSRRASVISTRPIARARDRDRRRLGGSDARGGSAASTPSVHQVSRSYSECRHLYQTLLACTDCKHAETCCCVLGSCPFWSMYLALRAFRFPRKTLLNHQSEHVRRQRQRALSRFMATILDLLGMYRDDFFVNRTPLRGTHSCKLLAALEAFLGVTPEVARLLEDGGQRAQLKLNLRGWRSDRKNLYFQHEDGERQQDAQALDTSAVNSGLPFQDKAPEPVPAFAAASTPMPSTTRLYEEDSDDEMPLALYWS